MLDKGFFGQLYYNYIDILLFMWYNCIINLLCIEVKMEKKYSAKKIINMIIFGLAITIFITMLIIFLTGDINQIAINIGNINISYLLIAIAFLLGYATLYPLSLCILTRSKKCDISMPKTYLIGYTEHFFNGITPFATGGQPFQVYAYSRLGVKTADSTGIIMMNFIIFMCVTNLFALGSLFFYPQLSVGVSNLIVMVIIGFSINFSVLIFFFVIATSKKFSRLLSKAMHFLCRSKRLAKIVTPIIPAFEEYCTQAQSAFKELGKNAFATISAFVIKAISMALYYSMTFYVLKAFNIDIGYDQFVFVMFSTSFAITMSVFIPTPGASGGIEFAFKAIFVAIAMDVSPSIATSGMLVWRMLTYYLMLLISFMSYIALEKITKTYEKNHPASSEPPADDSTLNKNETTIIIQDTDIISDTEISDISQDCTQVLIQTSECECKGEAHD